jgi:hypothetical protein
VPSARPFVTIRVIVIRYIPHSKHTARPVDVDDALRVAILKEVEANRKKGQDELTLRISELRVSFNRSAAGSATNAERYVQSAASQNLSALDAFFSHSHFGNRSDTAPELPSILGSEFQGAQQEALMGRVQYYEVKVTQPTFMNAIAQAAGLNDLVPFPAETSAVPPCLSVELKNGNVLRMFVGSNPKSCWIRGRLSPDFGLFVKGYKATEFSCLLIGEADNKESVKTRSLTNEHKGENLLYQREVLERCPFRSHANTPIYSFLTNNRQVQFLRSRVISISSDGCPVVEEQASQEVDMATGWPYLWQLLNATHQQLGYSLPLVTIEGEVVKVQSVIGSGAQGVCYGGEYCGESVVIKLSEKVAELYQERRVLGALRNHSQGIKVASIEEEKNTDDNQEELFLDDGSHLISEGAQAYLPVVVAYGRGVLIMSGIGESFNDDKRHGLCAEHVVQLLELHKELVHVGAFHMDICPRHVLCLGSGGLLVIDWGFALLTGDTLKSRLSGKGQYQDAASDRMCTDDLTRTARQLHSIVKTVYGLTHTIFMHRVLHCTLIDAVADAWEREWSSLSVGAVWREMANGEGIDRLCTFVRGGVVVSENAKNDAQLPLGYKSESGKCHHLKRGCCGAETAVHDLNGLRSCRRCVPKLNAGRQE